MTFWGSTQLLIYIKKHMFLNFYDDCVKWSNYNIINKLSKIDNVAWIE